MMSVFFNRLWLASGSYSTLYLSSFGAYAAMMHHQTFTPSIFHQVPRPVAGAAAFTVSFLFGVMIMGDSKECKHLLRNFGTYRKEYKMIREELYYN